LAGHGDREEGSCLWDLNQHCPDFKTFNELCYVVKKRIVREKYCSGSVCVNCDVGTICGIRVSIVINVERK
jgi:hypothetical protein